MLHTRHTPHARKKRRGTHTHTRTHAHTHTHHATQQQQTTTTSAGTTNRVRNVAQLSCRCHQRRQVTKASHTYMLGRRILHHKCWLVVPVIRFALRASKGSVQRLACVEATELGCRALEVLMRERRGGGGALGGLCATHHNNRRSRRNKQRRATKQTKKHPTSNTIILPVHDTLHRMTCPVHQPRQPSCHASSRTPPPRRVPLVWRCAVPLHAFAGQVPHDQQSRTP